MFKLLLPFCNVTLCQTRMRTPEEVSSVAVLHYAGLPLLFAPLKAPSFQLCGERLFVDLCFYLSGVGPILHSVWKIPLVGL